MSIGYCAHKKCGKRATKVVQSDDPYNTEGEQHHCCPVHCTKKAAKKGRK